ncbi:MAG: nagB, partial [Mucilaginibacter sp.]|nr:nagB [Mucilaginibacter sp.]
MKSLLRQGFFCVVFLITLEHFNLMARLNLLEETRYEKLPVTVYPNQKAASLAVAGRIASLIRSKEAKGEKTVLGLATGVTPIGVYAELVRQHREEGLSFKNVITFNLDEYYPMKPTAVQSYVTFMNENL